MLIEDSTYLLFINVAIDLVSIIKPYSSKYSKKTYTQQQLFILLILKQKLKLSYRELIEDIKTRDSVLLILGLFKIPSYTTLAMFSRRIKASLIEKIIGSCINFTRKKKLKLGIDATGYQLEDGSYYYRKRLGLSSKTRKSIKLSISVETEKQLIIVPKIRKSKAHDNKDFIPLVKKSNTIKQVKIAVADKGYDDEKNHIYVNSLNAECIIPPRDYGNNVRHRRLSNRNKLRKGYSKKKYHQRSKVETVNFVMKRVFGAVIYAKIWLMQKKEMLLKCLAYNIYRLVKLRI